MHVTPPCAAQKYDIMALLRSAATYAIVDGTLIIRFKTVRQRDMLASELEDVRCKATVSALVQEYLGGDLAVEPGLLSIKDYYIQAIRGIMDTNQIEESVRQPEYEIPDKATFETVVQYTEWYIAGGEQRASSQSKRHYRYDRYLRALQECGLSSRTTSQRITHIDIGCGPGLFSWALLDWARENQINYSGIDLYGYDHSQQMIELARQVQDGLRGVVSDYPKLHYYCDMGTFLADIVERCDSGRDYVITLGHVLAGNQDNNDINEYIRIVDQVLQLQDSTKPITVLASDATSGKHRSDFVGGWNKLLQALRARGVACTEMPVTTNYTGDRCVLLSRREV